MPIKKLIFALLLLTAFFIDATLGTGSKPILLIVVCAIIALYEFVSPYVYTPS